MSQDSVAPKEPYTLSEKDVSNTVETSDFDIIQGTSDDQKNMSRMGKTPELRRDFNFISIVGFMMILQATWESALLASFFGLYNGGTAGVIWMTIVTWICVMAMIASMAELASMAPTAGGQYHWVSEFAPRSIQKPLSYTVGWFCCLGWISGVPACGQFLAGLVQAVCTLIYGDDAPLQSLWQSTLLAMAFLLVVVGFNIFFGRHLATAEIVALVVHVVGFFVFLILFWAMGTKAPAKDVFTSFQDGGGWGSIGTSCLVGLATPLWCFIGPDAGAHMAEELKDASKNLPKAMMWATFFNGIVGIIMFISFCFVIGDLSIINDYDYPVVQVVYNMTTSYAAAVILVVLLLILTYLGSITLVASASRQAWAFARDGGFPYSSWIRQVHPTLQTPVNATLLSLGVALIILAIQFGSDVALNAVVSLSNAALVFSYIISIGCIRWKRFRGEPLLPRYWSLGKWGWLINDIGLAFLLVSFVFSFFPISPNPAPADMNWACLMFGFVAIFAAGFYYIHGHKCYTPPVVLVKPVEEL